MDQNSLGVIIGKDVNNLGTEIDQVKPTIVGITAPTKDDWSNEFELTSASADDGFHITTPTPVASSMSNVLGQKLEYKSGGTDNKFNNSKDVENIDISVKKTGPPALLSLQPRSHSRRIVRSLDWAKIQQIHQAQYRVKTEKNNNNNNNNNISPLTITEEDRNDVNVDQNPLSCFSESSFSQHSMFQQSPPIDKSAKSRKQRNSFGGSTVDSSSGSVSSNVNQNKKIRSVSVEDGDSENFANQQKDAIDSSFKSYDSVDSVAIRRIRRQQISRVQFSRITGTSNSSINSNNSDSNINNADNRLKEIPLLADSVSAALQDETVYDDDDDDDNDEEEEEDDGGVDKEQEDDDQENDFNTTGNEEHENEKDDDDDDSLSSASDWDAELEEEEQQQQQATTPAFEKHLEGLRNIVGNEKDNNNNLNNSEQNQIPKRWKLATQIKERSDNTPQVLRYPKPTALYSLRTKDGVRFMQEVSLEKWLYGLVSNEMVLDSDTLGPMEQQNSKRKRSSLEKESSRTIRKVLAKARPGTLGWSENGLQILWDFYSTRQDGICADSAVRMFRILGSVAHDRKKRYLKRSQSSFLSGSSETVKSVLSSPVKSSPTAAAGGGFLTSKREKSNSEDLNVAEDNEEEEDSDNCIALLKSLVHCFNLGVLSLPRGGEAFTNGDFSRSRGTTKESVPGCILSMIDGLKNWTRTQNYSDYTNKCVAMYFKILEAEAVAHQLATQVLDFQKMNTELYSNNDHMQKNNNSSKRRASSGTTQVSKPNDDDDEEEESNIQDRVRGKWTFSFPPPKSSAISFLSNEAQIIEAVLGQFCKTYLDAIELENEQSQQESHIFDPILLQANCLCNIQLLLNGMSPLSTTETNKLQDALDQLQLELEDWMTSKPIIEQQVIDLINRHDDNGGGANNTNRHDEDDEDYGDGISMCIGIVHQNYKENEKYLECERLCNVNPNYRMNKLFDLYMKISPNNNKTLKAKIAFVLAQYLWDEYHDSEKAEELLFEALYILKNLSEDSSSNSTNSASGYEKYSYVLSELATNTMVLYGDILVENGKYKYAIGSYESAVRSYKIREKKDYKWLYRRLCSICVIHMDWDRALKYHLEILHGTKLETNLNEFVYVSERVAMMLLNQRADFGQAEYYLKLALSYLKSGSNSNDNNNSVVNKPLSFIGSSADELDNSSEAHKRSLRIKLQQRLAHVLLAANRAEDAARLLSQVVTSIHYSSPTQSNGDSFSPRQTTQGLTTGSDILSNNNNNIYHHHHHDKKNTLIDGFNNKEYFDLSKNNNNNSLMVSSTRLSLLLLTGKCCLKLRWLADCTVALDSIAQDICGGKWCDPSRYPSPCPPRPKPSRKMINYMLSQLVFHSSNENALTYAILRARCCMYQGNPKEGLDWIDETLVLTGLNPSSSNLAMQSKEEELNSNSSFGSFKSLRISLQKYNNKHGVESADNSDDQRRSHVLNLTLGQIGRLYYYRGKILQMCYAPVVLASGNNTNKHNNEILSICRDCGKSIEKKNGRKNITDAFCEDLYHGILDYEMKKEILTSEECIDSLWRAFEYFQLIDDVLWQSKTLSRIAQVEIALTLNNENDKSDVDLDKTYETALMAIDLCADIGYGPLMLKCLLNMAELSMLQNDTKKAEQFWIEARDLLNTIYLTGSVSSTNPGGDKTFSFSQTNHTSETSNAKMEMEQALSNFLKLSSEKNQDSNNTTTMKEEKVDEGAAFKFPSVKIPGTHTSPGLTFRILQHSTRLLRLVVKHENVNFDNINKMFSSWNWLVDECWKQHGFCARIMLQENIRSNIYDDFLLQYVQTKIGNIRIATSAPTQEELIQKQQQQQQQQQQSPPHHRRNVSDSSNTSSIQNKQRERVRQLKQQLLHEDMGCKRCRIARQAELMTTEGRTNSTLWSCFHRLKLLAHGEIGHSLHMEEVRSQNLHLLRRIHELGCAAKSLNTTPNSSPVVSNGKVLLFRTPQRHSSSTSEEGTKNIMDMKIQEENNIKENGSGQLLFCGWNDRLVSNFQRVHDVLNLLETLKENECQFESKRVHDAYPTLYGMWDISSAIGQKDIFKLVSCLLLEKNIVVASSSCLVRSRAIEALLALIRPFRWGGLLLRNIPAIASYRIGQAVGQQEYIVGLDPSAVKDFVNGVYHHFLATTTSSTFEFVKPVLLNLDDNWVEFPSLTTTTATITMENNSVLRRTIQYLPTYFQIIISSRLKQFPYQQTWGLVAENRCKAWYQGMEHVLLDLLSYQSYFVQRKSKLFDKEKYQSSLSVEDPIGYFLDELVQTKLFQRFLFQKEVEKGPFRISLEGRILNCMKYKARIFRSLVGLTRGCWVWIAMVDHTIDGTNHLCLQSSEDYLMDEGNNDKSLLGSSSVGHKRNNSSGIFGNSSVTSANTSSVKIASSSSSSNDVSSTYEPKDGYTSGVKRASGQSLFASFGLSQTRSSMKMASAKLLDKHGKRASQRKKLKNQVIGCIANDIQKLQLSALVDKNVDDSPMIASPSSAFFQTKIKKKWIHLEEKGIRYHFRKSKTREKGKILLDPTRTRLVVPTRCVTKIDSKSDYDRIQACLDKPFKVRQRDIIEEPKPGIDDEYWIYLVTQLKDKNKARTIKIRFMDKVEEQLWIEAIRVKLMDPELLIRVLETAYVFQE